MDSDHKLLLLRPTAAHRPPSWRWQLAARVRDARARYEPHLPTDPYTEIAVGMQTDIKGAHSGTERATAIGRYGVVADAYAFWSAGTVAAAIDPKNSPSEDGRIYGPLSEDAIALAEMEAMILARKKPEYIAKHTGLSTAAIIWYERLWFDVRDRLGHPGWIATNVIGSLHQGTVGSLLPALIRAYGYYSRSARIVKAAASSFDSQAARKAARETPDKYFSMDAVISGSLKAALAVRLTPMTDSRTYGRIIELHQEALRVAADTNPAPDNVQIKHREAFERLAAKVKYGFHGGGSNVGPNRVLPVSAVRLTEDDEAVG